MMPTDSIATKVTEMENSSTDESLLDLQSITMIYPGTIALNQVNLNIKAGECHGVIGKNGAGKTTLMNIISGIIRPSEGQIFINGRQMRSFSRIKSRDEGIFIITQEPQIIPEFTVAENLFYPNYFKKSFGKIDWNSISKQAELTVQKAGLRLNIEAKASDLSISEQQLLLILKAFFASDDRVIILDEVTAALTKKDQEFLFQLIEKQTTQGKAVLFISHRLSEIMRVCDRISVLRDGEKIATKHISETTEADLSRLIVGNDSRRDIVDHKISKTYEISCGETILQVDSLTLAGGFQNISLELARGEVLGIAGLRGSGRTEFLKTLAGVFRADNGTIKMDGEIVALKTPGQALKRGIVYLPEDRDQEGLIQNLSVRLNLTLSSIWDHTKGIFINEESERKKADELVNALEILATSLEQEVQSLSGGNRQKVVIGKLILLSPRIFLLDEPTKGIDISAKKTMLDIVRNRLVRNAAVVLTSPSLEELIQTCDRIIVLHEGLLTKHFYQKDFDYESIYLAMQGVTQSKAK
jgi:ABC-type sugar transport system ATPase subunit